ncbi:hypothetical protein GQ85_19875 [Rhodococcus rhodochrous]|nr:hypothetical protein GQ85_19875 [Rhodococcus rhodochrous]
MPHRHTTTFACTSMPWGTAEELAVFGVRIADPHGPVAYRLIGADLMVEVGQVVVIGATIHAVPHRGLTARQLGHLAGAVEDAFLNPPADGVPGWAWSVVDGVPRWTTHVSVPVEEISAVALTDATAGLSDRPDAPIG